MKSGFVAILGLPNAGKSTLINSLVGAKVAIVSPKAQTTRDAVQGIVNRPEGQIIFVDSPGIHDPKFELGRRMTREIDRAADGCAAVVYVADARRDPGEREAQALGRLRRIEAPAVLALNKIDRLADKSAVLARIDEFRRLHEFAEYVPLSALSGDGLDLLVRLIFERLPEGPPFYPDDSVTDQSERFLGAELIRERILRETSQEVPHHSAVVVEHWEESEKLLRVAAVIYVERPSQKAILLGQKGAMMKRIATRARQSIEARFDKRVYLEMFVKVKPKWRDSAGFIRELDRARAGSGASALQIADIDPLP